MPKSYMTVLNNGPKHQIIFDLSNSSGSNIEKEAMFIQIKQCICSENLVGKVLGKSKVLIVSSSPKFSFLRSVGCLDRNQVSTLRKDKASDEKRIELNTRIGEGKRLIKKTKCI